MNKVIYSSISKKGNTRKLAEAVAAALQVPAEDIKNDPEIAAVDTLFIGTGVYAGHIDASLKEFLQKLDATQVKQVAVFSSSFRGNSPLEEIKHILGEKGISVLDDTFSCKASFLFMGKGKPTAEDIATLQAFAKRVAGI